MKEGSLVEIHFVTLNLVRITFGDGGQRFLQRERETFPDMSCQIYFFSSQRTFVLSRQVDNEKYVVVGTSNFFPFPGEDLEMTPVKRHNLSHIQHSPNSR